MALLFDLTLRLYFSNQIMAPIVTIVIGCQLYTTYIGNMVP